VREIVGLGVGLAHDQRTDLPRIKSVWPNSPAGRARLATGLHIEKINGAEVKGKSLPECIGMMAGPVGTKVQLELFDPERKESKAVELTKEKFLMATGLDNR